MLSRIKKNIHSNFTICILFFTFQYTSINSQELSELLSENIIPLSPSQEKIAQFGILNSSEHLGAVNISIPLLKINTIGIEIPITLTYQSTGIKVTEESDWVGLGWNLSFATITQKVFGKDDLNTKFKSRKLKLNYVCCNLFGLYSYNQSDTPSFTNMQVDNTDQEWDSDKTYSFIKFQDKKNCNNWSVTNYYPFDSENYDITDTEKDLFIINLFGVDLFVVLPSNIWTTPPFNSIGISEIPSTIDFLVLNKKGFQVRLLNKVKWEIVDPNGVKYIFDEINEIKTTSISNCDYEEKTVFNEYSHNWNISKIIDIYGDSIIFKYHNKDNIISRHITQSRKVGRFTFQKQGVYYEGGLGWFLSENCGPFKTVPKYVNNLVSSREITNTTVITENKSYLESIWYNGNIINFYLKSDRIDKANTMRLDSIVQKNFNSEIINKTSFSYNYFKSPKEDPLQSENSPNINRLSLTSVENKGNKYFFLYNCIALPNKESNAVDFWGYYNGKNLNLSKLPNILDFHFETNADFLSEKTQNCGELYSVEEFAKACILESVFYPTGGHSEYKYSLNRFSNYFVPTNPSYIPDGESIGNGLRVDSIINYDQNNMKIGCRTFKYEEGKLMSPFKPFYYEQEQYSKIAESGSAHSRDIENYSCNILNIHSYSQYTNWIGNNGVGYGKITTQDEIANLKNGKTIRYFSNNADIIPCVSMGELIPIVPTYHKGIKNGSLLKEEIFDINDILKQRTNFSYNVTSNCSTLEYNGKIKSLGYESDGVICNIKKTILVSYYPLYKSETLLTKKRVVNYFNNDSVVSINNFSFNQNDQIFEKVQEINNLKVLKKNYYYPLDISLNSDYEPAQRNIMNSLLSLNRVNEIIKVETSIKIDPKTIILKTNYNEFGEISLLPENIKFSYGQNPLETLLQIKYDSTKRIIQKTKSDKTPVSYLWSYNNQYPIAEIYNSKYEDVLNALGLDKNKIFQLAYSKFPDVAEVRRKLDKFFSDKNSLISTYTYKPLLGIEFKKNPRDISHRYIYDSLGRLSVEKDNSLNVTNYCKYHFFNEIQQENNKLNSSAPIICTLQPLKNIYFGINNRISVKTSGGSGFFEYDWYLKDKSGVVLQSKLNSNLGSFEFIYNQTGIVNIECIIKDVILGSLYTCSTSATSFTPLSVEFLPYSNQLMVNQLVTINAYVSGNNGSYTTKWKILKSGESEQEVLSSTNTLNYRFSTAGYYIISFIVSDNISGEVFTKITDTITVNL